MTKTGLEKGRPVHRTMTIGGRVSEHEYALVDAAARLRRQSRSDYLREVAVAAAEADLRAAGTASSAARESKS